MLEDNGYSAGWRSFSIQKILTVATGAVLSTACGHSSDASHQATRDQPPTASPASVDRLNNGKAVFRYETFGNEGFWTDAVRLPQGVTAARLTPLQALKAGLSVNTEVLDSETLKAIADEIRTQGTRGPLLNSFDTTLKLLNANAVIGVVVKDSNGDGALDLAHGDKAGVSCVLCHAVTDKSAFDMPGGGSIGKEIDGPAVHNINVGAIFAMAANTKAFYPMAQLMDEHGKSIGRAPSEAGLTKDSSEADFDAYFGNPRYYPIGMFDDTPDGNGNPMHNTPMFRADLSAPFGSSGEIATVEQFANTVYTELFDPTNLLLPGGRTFLHTAAGASGDRLVKDYKEVLAATGVKGYPYVKAQKDARVATGDALIGLRVDDQKLADEALYMKALRSPQGVVSDLASVQRGRAVYVQSKNACIQCHGISQSQPVPNRIIPMRVIWPGDSPMVIAARNPPLSPVENTMAGTFDDKMIVINASLRGLERGVALPLLMDLARKPVFLHDNSVPSLDNLFDKRRGAKAPHPFYVENRGERSDLVAFLNSLDDRDGL